MDRRCRFLTVLQPGAGAAAAQNSRPLNFIFILVDDWGWTDLGCYGSKSYDTPNIDKLASQGMRFTNAYAACPVCSPTRASILTGTLSGAAASHRLDPRPQAVAHREIAHAGVPA